MKLQKEIFQKIKYRFLFMLTFILPICLSIQSQEKNLNSLLENLRNIEKLDCFYYQKLDSLKSLIEDCARNNCKNSKYIEAKQFYASKFSFKNPLESLKILEESILESKDFNYNLGIAVGNHEMGMIYYRQGLYEKSIQVFHKSSKMFLKTEQWWEYGFSLIDIGNVYYRQRILTNAKFYYKKALNTFLEHFPDGEFENAAAVSYNNLGLVAYVSEKYDSALVFFKHGLKLREDIKLKAYYGHSKRYIAHCYKKLGYIDSASIFFNEAIESDKLYGPKNELVNSYLDLGDFRTELHEFDKAKFAYERGYQIALNHGLYPQVVSAANELAGFYESLNNIDFSKKYCRKAYAYADSAGQINGKLNAANKLYAISKLENDLKNQLIYLEEINRLEGILNNDKISYHQLEYELSERIRDSETYKTANKWKLIGISTVSFIAVLLLILAIVFYKGKTKQSLLNNKLKELSLEIFHQAKELKEANNNLMDNNEEILQQREEIKAQAESLQDSLKKLRELNEFKEGMTSMIVHDLKHPLNVIINRAKDSTVEEAGRQMLNMINNILDVHRFESTKMPVVKDKVKLLNLCNSSITKVEYLYNQKNISIYKRLHDCEIFVDNELIERVFINLLSNAIKYTPANGKIELFSEIIDNEELKISIKDNGPGIPKGLKNRVFDKFIQIIAKKTGETRSSGLGLTFCKLAVEAHDGSIDVDTEIGRGTTFWFILPLVKTSKDQNHKKISSELPIKISNNFIQQQLTPYIEKLRTVKIYEISEIQKIISEIKSLNLNEIDNWLKALENSAYSVAQSDFNTLLAYYE